MSLTKKILSSTIVTTFFVAGLTGCNQNPVSSDIQDNEISASSAGKLAVESFSDIDSLSTTFEAASQGLDPLGTQELFVNSMNSSIQSGNSVMKKARAAVIDPFNIDLSDTINGEVKIYIHNKTLQKENFDTVAVKWDQFAKDSIQDNENIISIRGKTLYSWGRDERYSIVDLDNDGVVAGQAQSTNKARFILSVVQTNDVVDSTVIDIGAGADNNFDVESDNTILQMSWKKIKKGTTVSYARFSDADGDGMLLNRASTDLSYIDVDLFDGNNPLKPFVEHSNLKMRVVTDGNNANNLLVKLSGEEKRVSGRVSKFYVTDKLGDSIITKDEDAIITFETVSSPESDPVRAAKVVATCNVKSGLQNENDNIYYSIDATQEKRMGWVRNRTFKFTSDTGFRSGEDPKSGHVEMSVTYFNGKSASLVADFNETGFSGTYTNPQGETVSVQWDRNGNVVSGAN